MVDYYSPETADSGYPAFRWKEVLPPDSVVEPGVVVDASSRDAWVYLTLEGETVTLSDAASSTEWDLAFQRTGIRTNGGVSGPGFGGARETDEPWDSITAASTVGFVEDALLPVAGPPGSGEAPGNAVLGAWFDYDGATHVVSPRDTVFLIRGASGDYAKMRVLAWDSGVFRVELEPVTRLVDRRTTTVDASSTTEWVRLSFRAGELVTVEDATTDLGWDVAFQRTLAATNSGTAGAGEGGAARASSSDLDAITDAAESYVVDVNVPPSRPGASAYDGNPVLGAWFDYDPVTHVVSPADAAFLVRTADGGHVKLRITGWEGGIYTLDWAYAGAGQTRF
jgi:hypothetical protein